MEFRNLGRVATFFVLGGLALSCGNSGGSSAAVPLSAPAQMNIVTAQGSGGTGSVKIGKGYAAASNTEYATDPVDLWIYDESMEPLDLVNVILCSIRQTGFYAADVLNTGPYMALVACESERGDSNASAGRVQFDEFTVDSSRADGSSPHLVKFWFDQTQNMGSGTMDVRLYGKLTILESPSAAKPFGRFNMSWKQLAAADNPSTGTVLMKGSLKTIDRSDGQAEFELDNFSGDVDAQLSNGQTAFRMRAHVLTNGDFSAGKGYTETRNAWNMGSGTQTSGSEYYIEFNSRYLARKKVASATVTKVFDRQNYTTTAFRYGIYDETTEARIKNNGGFPIETQSGVYGWVGYHGMWFPSGVTITTGQTLIRRSYDTAVPNTNYTAFVAPGRLEKRSSSTSTFANIKDEEFETWDKGSNTNMKVVWSASGFNKVATFNMSTGQWSSVTPSSVSGQYSTDEFVSMSNSARGSVEFTWPSGGLTDNTQIKTWRTDLINGDSTELSAGNLTLYAYFNMLKSSITSNQANYQNSESPYFPDAANVSQGKIYVFDKQTLTLKLSGVGVTLQGGVTVTQGPRINGFDCGPLLTSALGNLNGLWSQSTTYNWVTGTQDYNQFRTVKTTQGAFVSFDAPLRFSYTHTETGNAYNGKVFSLELNGAELNGIPYAPDSGGQRWYPGFNIPNGSILTDSQNKRYKTKVIEGEQRMTEVNNPSAIIAQEGFDLTNTLSKPASSYVDPAIGARPTVTDPPKFVEGERQGN